jgi:protein SCO1/2
MGASGLPRLAMLGASLFSLAVCSEAPQKQASGPPPEASRSPTDAPPDAPAPRWSGVPYADPLPRPRFVLTDTRGRSFDFHAETEGFLTLLFFGYTSCPDICPVHLAQLAAVLRRVSPEVRQQVKVVFVAVDPARDTPERVRNFLDRFDPRFIGLVGTPEELQAAQAAASVPPASVDQEWEGGYSVSHAGWITLYTKDDLARLRYPFGTRQIEWARDLPILVQQGWPGE